VQSISDSKIKALREIIERYLAEHKMTGLACFTNRLPTREERMYLSESFCYICFCVKNIIEQYETHFLFWKNGYNRLSYDVYVGGIEKYICLRGSYGYISLDFKDQQEAEQGIIAICTMKSKINSEYPILLRVINLTGPLNDFVMPSNLETIELVSADERIMKIL
jgi:hypothetical protein